MKVYSYIISLVSLSLILLMSCNKSTSQIIEKPSIDNKIEIGHMILEFDQKANVKLSSDFPNTDVIMDGFQNADYLIIDGNKIEDFVLESVDKSSIEDKRGEGTQWNVTAKSMHSKVVKKTSYQVFEKFPSFIFTQTEFFNNAKEKQILNSWNTNHIHLKNQNDQPSYYAFQGSSTSHRSDWIRKVDTFFYDKNYMGMNNSDYGGGIPVVDLWRPDAGVSVGHIELTPKLVSFPTELKGLDEDASIRMSKSFEYPTWMHPGESIMTPKSFYSVHTGDYYATLREFSLLMVALGIEMVPSEEAAYEPIWCAWGYERDFTKDEIIGTLDKVKELGIKWAVVDDGFQVAEGDWNLKTDKFPNGNSEMKGIVDAIHDKDLKAKIWWTPLAADPGSKVLQENPKSIIYTDEWAPQFITWWDSYYLSPTNPHTQNHTKEVIKLFIDEWGFDGLKMDGQHMNAVPPDHNPEAGIEYPEMAPEMLPSFFKMIYDETTKLKPNAVIENCPCGTCMSFYNMASMNQAVSSDPLSSWQIRHKGKTYKALVPHIAYYGDHVELSDNASDFASSFGIGAVLGTKFTYPKDNPNASESFLLTPEKEKKWKHWFSLYNEMMLSKGLYIGDLYDIGYDKPEAHVVKKDETLYYAFYAKDWNGEIEFKGIDSSKKYSIYDYVNNQEVGQLKPGQSKVNLKFDTNLLVRLNTLK